MCRPMDHARNAEIVRMFRSGMTGVEIAPLVGLTGSAVSQLLRACGVSRAQGGKALKWQQHLAEVRLQRNQQYGWELSLADWWRIWRESGQWSQRGRSTGTSAVMARRGDVGPYSAGNVYITTLAGNFVESHAVRGHHIRSELLKDPVCFPHVRRG